MKVYFLLYLLLFATNVQAELEAGLGLGIMRIPHYLGSNESETYVLPIPYIRYRSENLNIDRNFVQQKLFQHGKWSMELSISGTVPVDNDKSSARKGMDDLDFIGELGPSLQYHFDGDRLSDDALYLSMPIRSAISTDFTQASFRGYTFNPRLIWRKSYQYEDFLIRSQVSSGLRFASYHMHEYIYGVDAQFETPQRDQYYVGSGYGGLTLSYNSSVKFEGYMLAGFVRYANIAGASFEGSPLVQQNLSILVGGAWIYLF